MCQSEVSVSKFRITRLQENVAVQNYEVKETKDQFLCPFPRMVTDTGSVGHSVTFVDLTHMSIVILYNGRLQGISTLLTKVTFCWWIMNI